MARAGVRRAISHRSGRGLGGHVTPYVRLDRRGRAAPPPSGDRTLPAGPKLHTIRLGSDAIRFEVRRSARRVKTIHIKVERDRVILAAPMRTPLSEARDIIRKRSRWILAHTAKMQAEPPQLPVDGGGLLPFMGDSIPLMVESAPVRTPTARQVDGKLRVEVPLSLDQAQRDEAARNAVAGWLRSQATERLPAEVERWWPRLGRGGRARIRIGNQRRQWANCSVDGTMRFSWRVMMLDPELIEYVVVHEMAHLTRMDHSKDFWALVAWAMPDAASRRRRLREAQDLLPL